MMIGSMTSKQVKGHINNDKNTLIIFGDSLSAAAGDVLSSPWTGHITIGNAMAGNPFSIIKNSAIGGQTSDQITARVLSDVIAFNPSHCIFLCGMNDNTSASDTLNLKNNIYKIYSLLNTAGIYSFICTNTTTSDNIGKNKQAIQINGWMAEYFKNLPNCEIIDLCQAWIDPTNTNGYPLAEMMRDAVHQGNLGGWHGGKKIAQHFSRFPSKSTLPTSALDSYFLNTGSSQILKNPIMAGTAGYIGTGNSGVCATEYYLYRVVNATAIGSKEVRTDINGEYQVLDITSTAANDLFRFETKPTAYLPVINDIFTFEVEYNLISSTNLRQFAIRVYDDVGEIISYFNTAGYPTVYPLNITSEQKLILKTGEYTFTRNVSNLFIRMEAYFTGPGGAVIKIGRVAVRKVN